MSFSGMDVEEVETLAASLDLQVKAITGVVTVVDGAVGALAQVWHGPDLTAFHGLWMTARRPAAQTVADQLGVWVTELRREAQEQRAASGVGGGVGGGGGWGAAGSVVSGLLPPWATVQDAWGILGEGNTVLGLLTGAATVGAKFAHDVRAVPSGLPGLLASGRSGAAVDAFLKAHPGMLHDLGKTFDDLESGRGWKALDGAGHAVDIAGAAINGARIGHDIATGDYHDAVYDGAETSAGLLKSSKNPVAYLGGMAVQAWVQVGEAAETVDWSPSGTALAWDYIKHNPGSIASSGWDALKAEPAKLWEILT